jgi:hypothetical protein
MCSALWTYIRPAYLFPRNSVSRDIRSSTMMPCATHRTIDQEPAARKRALARDAAVSYLFQNITSDDQSHAVGSAL